MPENAFSDLPDAEPVKQESGNAFADLPDAKPAESDNAFSDLPDAEPVEASTLETTEDFGRDVMAGFSRLYGGTGWLVNQVGADSIGQTMMEQANDSAKWWLEGQSAEAKYDRSKDFLSTDEEGNYQLGDFNLGTVLHQTAESLPATGLGLGAGGAAAKGLGALGAGAKTAGAVGYGAGEASVAAPMVGSEVYEEVKNTDHETLYENSPAYKKLYDQLDGLDEERRQELANEPVAQSASRDAALMAGGSTFALSAPAGAVMPNMPLGKVMNQTRATGAIKGGGTETVQEFFQEGSEGVAGNIAAQLHYDPERGTFEGVPNQALGGALSGTAMGTAFGGAATPQAKGPAVDSDEVIGEAEEVRVEGDQPDTVEDRRRQDEVRAAKDDAINRGADPQAILDTASEPPASSEPEAQKDEMVARFNELGPRQEAEPEPVVVGPETSAETEATVEPESVATEEAESAEPTAEQIEASYQRTRESGLVGGKSKMNKTPDGKRKQAQRLENSIQNQENQADAAALRQIADEQETKEAPAAPESEPQGDLIGEATPEPEAFEEAGTQPESAQPEAAEESAPEPAAEYFDERLKSQTYHDQLDTLVSEWTAKGGGAGELIRDSRTGEVVDRAQSMNPEWAQNIRARHDPGKKFGPYMQKAVEQAKSGRRLGSKQQAVVGEMLDEIDSRKAESDQLEAENDPMAFTEADADLEVAEFDQEEQALYETIDRASEAGVDQQEIEDSLEMEPDRASARLERLIKETESGGLEEGLGSGEATQGGGGEPAAAQTDFAQLDPDEQQRLQQQRDLEEAQQDRDEQRQGVEGQVGIDEGGGGPDLFSPEAQTDMLDQGAEDSTGAVQETEADLPQAQTTESDTAPDSGPTVGDSGTKFQVGDRVSMDDASYGEVTEVQVGDGTREPTYEVYTDQDKTRKVPESGLMTEQEGLEAVLSIDPEGGDSGKDLAQIRQEYRERQQAEPDQDQIEIDQDIAPESQDPDLTDPDLSYSLTQAARNNDLPGAPVYFSAALEGARAIKSDKGPPKYMLKQLKNQPGVKQEELDWLGVEPWIEAQEGKVTREQLIEFIEANRIEVDEVVQGGEAFSPNITREGKEGGYAFFRDEKRGWRFSVSPTGNITGPNGENIPVENGSPVGAIERWVERQSRPEGADRPAQYQSMTPPLGENYREFLLTLPNLDFKEPHFNTQGVVAHIRADERFTDKGEPVVAVWENQSYLHQRGAKEGYEPDSGTFDEVKAAEDAVDEAMANLAGFYGERAPMGSGRQDDLIVRATRDAQEGNVENTDELYDLQRQAERASGRLLRANDRNVRDAEARAERDKVPDAPLKTNWDMLVMKRMIRHAAEKGYERMVWPATGEQVARVEGWDNYRKEGEKHYNGEQDMTAVVERYTKRLPNALRKYGKRWGATVEKVGVETALNDDLTAQVDQMNSLRITPEMRNYALGGQPLFSLARDKPAGISKTDLDEAVQAYKQTTGSQRSITTVADEAHLPPAHFRQLAADGVFGQAEGYLDTYTGDIYLVGSNLAGRQRAMEVVAHEEFHVGLRPALGDDVIPVLNEAAKKPEHAEEVNQIARQYGLDLSVSTHRHIVGEEMLARMAERGEESTTLDKLITKVREFLRKLGVKAGLSNSELRVIVSRAGRAARSGNARVYMMADNRYSVAPSEEGKSPRHTSVFRQPIDQIFRLPFKLTFGLDEQGQLNYPQGAHRAADKLREAYRGARASIKDKAPHVEHFLERAERGLLDDLGTMPDRESYKASRETLSTDQRHYAKFAIDLYEKMVAAGVDKNEAQVLHDMIVGDAPNEGDLTALSDPIKASISELGKDMVANGTLSREAFERWDGQYLHRFYQESAGANSGPGAFVAKVMGAKRKKLYEQSYKGRGMQVQVATKKIVDQISDDWWGKSSGQSNDAAVQGMKFQMFDLIPAEGGDFFAEGEGSDRPTTLGQKGRAKERVLVPEGMPIPERYTRSDSEYTHRGTWEARKTESGTTTLWRDFTKAEREYMGEITDARYTVTKTFHLAGHNVAVGNWYKTLSENDAWARDHAPEEAQEADRVADKDTRVRDRTYAGYDWVQVPNEKVPKSDTLRFGALSGKFVRAEIWRDIQEYDRMNNSSTLWQTILTQWKLNKTARNPVVHTNNVMSNMLFMDMQDVTFADLKDAIRAFYNHKTSSEGDPNYIDARDHNAFQGLFAESELNYNVLDPVLQEINESQAAEADQAGMWSKEGATRMWRLTEKMWHAFDNTTTEAYQSEDEVFRLAVYMKKVREGMSKEDAAPLARKSMLDYDISAPWINNLRRSVLPFISYTYRAVPVVAESMVQRPWKLLKYATVAHVAQAISYAIADGDEEEERKALREDQQGYTWIGVPRMLRTPFGGEDNPVYLDIKRWIPVGDVFDTNQGQIDFLPAPLQFAGPLMLGAEFYLNKVSFTGEEIMDRETDTAMEQAQGYADWMWKSWMPSAPWIPNSWYWEKIGAAARGGTSSMGTPYSMTAAIASSMGIKANPVNVKEGKMWRARGIKWKIDKVKKGMRDDIMEYERNLIDKDELNERLETHRDKIKRYQEDFEDLL